MLLMVFLLFYSFLGYFSRFSISLTCFVGVSSFPGFNYQGGSSSAFKEVDGAKLGNPNMQFKLAPQAQAPWKQCFCSECPSA